MKVELEGELNLGVNAIKVLRARYLLKDKSGKIIETPKQLFKRVAETVAKVDGKSAKNSELEFYRAMVNREFMPNSPTLMNAGTRNQMLSACFVLPIEDSLDGIFDTLKNAAKIQQVGGGTGFSFSKLRPRGDIVGSTHGVASGPVSFMKIYDMATEVIKQGSRRRGANIGILDVNHPDIIEFVTSKETEGVLRNFNISVAVDDKFMKAALNGKGYWLINPHSHKKVSKLNARNLLKLITTMAWRTGDPGMVFIDEINRRQPTPKLGKIESTNPCVSKDTLVTTNVGIVEIEKTHNPMHVMTYDGFKPLRWVGQTGLKEVFRVKTNAGYEVEATENHKFLTSNGWKELKNLTSGDKLILQEKGIFGKVHIDKEFAFAAGWLIGDGHFSSKRNRIYLFFNKQEKKEILPVIKNYLDELNKKGVKISETKTEFRIQYSSKVVNIFRAYGFTPLNGENKVIPKQFFLLDKKSMKYFLSALFSTDGSVQGTKLKGVSVRLASNSLKLLKQVQLLLLQFGIFCTIYENRRKEHKKMLPDSNRQLKEYTCKAQHELIISRRSMFKFMHEVGFCLKEKNNKFERIKPLEVYRDNINLQVGIIEKLGMREVYDLQEPITHSFAANGIIVHNCGEVDLLPYESCNLGSINLSKIVENQKINWDKLKKLTWLGVHFLDNVIDANKYPVKETEKITLANRKIGLGVMGLAEMFILLGIKYDSDKALKTAEQVIKFIRKEADSASKELAKKRGSFPNISKSKIKKPKRNATVLSIAPTGTISIIAETSSGIEPLFAISFVREVLEGTQLLEVNPLFEQIAKENNFYSKDLMVKISKKGSIQSFKEIPKEIRNIFVTALDISPEWHIKMQSVFQKHVDNAVSKTVNLPHNATVEDIKKIYLLAYKLKCKGVTVYRYGSKSEQVLYLGDNLKSKKSNVKAHSEYSGGCVKGECPF